MSCYVIWSILLPQHLNCSLAIAQEHMLYTVQWSYPAAKSMIYIFYAKKMHCLIGSPNIHIWHTGPVPVGALICRTATWHRCFLPCQNLEFSAGLRCMQGGG
jgi:hypothetical protein